MPVLDEWNQRCVPPWSEKELRRKLEYADKKETKRGRLLANRIEPSKNTTMPADSANEIANVEGAFPVVIPDFFQWDKIQARPTLPVPCLDKLGRINKHPMLSREWVLDIVRHAVVAQRCSQVLLPDIYFAHLIWGCKDWPANWRQIIARALWNCAPDILPTSNQVDWTEDEEVSEIPDEKEWRRGELNCYQVCPFYGRHCAPHRHFRLTLPEESWGVMRSFVSETIQKNVVEFDFRNIKWTREEVKARKAKLKDELAKRREVMENPVFPDFDHFLAQAEFEAVEKEMNNIRVGGHRVKEVLAVYVLARIFGPSPHSGLTHLQCNILKALPMQLTRAPRNNDRADKALVVNVDSSDDPTTEYPVPVCPNLESGHFIMFNGNRAYRRYRHHGYGFKIATWMENAGYPSTAKYISFLRDLEHLQRDFGLAVFGWNRLDRQWRPLREMLSTCRTTIGRTWLDQCVLRIYATEDYLTRWRRYFAERLGFASIPGGEGENRRPEKKVKKQSRIVIQSASELQGWMTTQGLSDQRLADALGVNRATVSHYRTGYRRWSRKFQEKVALHIAGTQ